MKNYKILTQPVLPKVLHGINPRTIMGDTEWNKIKKNKQEIANHHCMCCDEYVAHVPGDYLECHEVYEINHEKHEFKLIDVVCICRKCHEYIHLGRLQMLLKEGKITETYYKEIVERAKRLLNEENLKRENLSIKEINNLEWKLVYKDKKYPNN